MTSVTKKTTFFGIVWSGIERFSVQGSQFFLGLIVARLVSPSDYGMIGMLAIFISLSQAIADGGFSQALLQKKHPDENDYNTVFYINFLISLFIYVLLFLVSPYIASFYETPVLEILTKVLGINIIIFSFNIVQRTQLTKNIDFKTQTKASITSVIIGGLFGIYFAYQGYGIWALVIQSLCRNLLNTSLLWHFSDWKPRRIFSLKSFKSLFSFGSKLLITHILVSIFENLYIVIIGKFYSATQIGFYTRAIQFQQFPSKSVTNIVQRVSFPTLSLIQDDNSRLRSSFSKFNRYTMFIVAPSMIMVGILADPLVRIVLTEKWIEIVPLIQLFVFVGLVYPLHSLSLNILKAKGRSDLFLKLELIKNFIILISLTLSFSFGVKAIVISQILSLFISYYINSIYIDKIIKFSFWNQIRDLLPVIILSSVTGLIVFISVTFLISDLMKVVLGGFCGVVVYIGLSVLFKFREIDELKFLLVKKQNM